MSTLYSHEILSTTEGTFIAHNRVNQRASGLLTSTHLATTFRFTLNSDQAPRPGLELPTFLDTIITAATRSDGKLSGIESAMPTRTIECESMKDFIESGKREWRVAYATYGRVMIEYAQNRRDGEFVNYIATPAELDAINEIASANSSANSDDNNTLPGFYM